MQAGQQLATLSSSVVHGLGCQDVLCPMSLLLLLFPSDKLLFPLVSCPVYWMLSCASKICTSACSGTTMVACSSQPRESLIRVDEDLGHGQKARAMANARV